MESVKASEALRQRGLECFYYLAPPENVQSILEKGILTYTRVRALGIVPRSSLANEGVQGARQSIVVFNRSLHSYVPLYLVSSNPTLHDVAKRGLQRAYIRVRLEVVDKPGVVFADGNAASKRTNFYRDVPDISKLPWETLMGRRRDASPNWKRQRCSEVLVPDIVEANFIIDVRCTSPDDIPVHPKYKHLLVSDWRILLHSVSFESVKPSDLLPD